MTRYLRKAGQLAHSGVVDPRGTLHELRWDINKLLLHRTTLTGYICPYDVSMHVRVFDDIGYRVWHGQYEMDVYNFMSKYLQKGMTFFDIGANVGLFTVIGATKVGPEGHVYAFEPSQREVHRLRANVDLNLLKNVTINTNEAPPQTDEIYATQKLDSIATSSHVQDI